MNSSPLIIVVIIVISALVFGGIILFGLHNAAAPTTPSPVTSGTVSHIPDILNLPGFGSRQNQLPAPVPPSGTRGPDIVVQTNELPSPILPAAPTPPAQQQKFSTPIYIVPPRQTQSQPNPIPRPQPQPIPQPMPPPRQSPQVAAIASFSVFNVSPQLRYFRTQMVKEGAIKENEFVKINTNKDMEAFLLKLVEWRMTQPGSTTTPEQMQDARDRITKAYDQIQAAGAGR